MQNNPITEVAMPVGAILLVMAGSVLLYLGKIDVTFASFMFVSALGLLGYNGALKAPSPAQQAQQNAQQQNVQQLLSQALAVLPVFASLLHSHTPAPQVTMSAHPVQAPQAPVVPPQPAQAPVPMQSSVVPEVTPTPTPPNFGTITTGFQSPEGTSTTTFVPSVPQRDAWSNSSLMQAIGKPPQQQ